jgi:hypothetical protein
MAIASSLIAMSALTPRADIGRVRRNVRFVPKADIGKTSRTKKKYHLAAFSPKSDQVF